ncbi:MAG: hypothetical protein C4523_07480 [Myxococcales bacterium]|nr:MAG: hypothetical protein C4523_07480 [Myxococcales bacterium]
MTAYTCALTMLIVLNAFGQLLLRSGSARGETFWRSLLHPRSVAGYLIFLVVTVLSVYVMQAMPLRAFTAWTSLVFPAVVLLSALLLKEKLTRDHLFGTTLIVAGIVVFSTV